MKRNSMNVLFFIKKAKLLKKNGGSLRVYAHHSERCASGKQHPHEH